MHEENPAGGDLTRDFPQVAGEAFSNESKERWATDLRLTETVETLGALADGDARLQIGEIAAELRALADRLVESADGIGITQRGPIDKAMLCTSFEEFQQVFGSFTPNSDLALAAMGFFENGGSMLWAVRTVHHTDIADPASAAAVRGFAYLLAPGVPTPARLEGQSATGIVTYVETTAALLGVLGSETDENVIESVTLTYDFFERVQ